MKRFKPISFMLLGAAITAALPLAAGVFKKEASKSTIDMSERKTATVSQKKHSSPPETSPAAATAGIRLRGLVVTGDIPYIGEITIDDNGVKVANIHSDYNFDASGSAVYADGKFYTQYTYQPSVGETYTAQVIYDAQTWEVIEERDELLPSSSATCITYDPIDCAAYGYFLNDDGDDTWFGFGRMNMATGETFLYNNVDANDGFMCIAASPDGFLYGIDVHGQFCRINKKDGKITVLGHTDVKPYYIQSAVVDWNTGTFYWAAMTDTGEAILYTIDPVTYIAKEIGPMPDNQEIIGLYVVEDLSAADTPAAAKEITVGFDKDNLSGTVSFEVPEATVDGKPLSSGLKAHVAVDGKHFEADATPGQKCSIAANVSANDLYMFTVWVTDSDKTGVKATAQKWIGADRPCDLTNVKCVNNNGHIILTWDPASETGQHGGYVNPATTTYVVGRNGGESMPPVHDIKTCKFEEDLPADLNTRVTYYVRAVNHEMPSNPIYSNEIFIGSDVRTVPLEFNVTSLNDCIVKDSNKDNTTWESTVFGYAKCDTPESGADDWILTPKIALKGGEIYELSYEVSTDMGFFNPQDIEVKAGSGDTEADMTLTIDTKEVATLKLTQFNTETVTFTVPTDGDYRLGFHNCSTGSGTLGMSTFSLKALGASSGPVAPASAKVEPFPMGELKATISFTAPSEDSEGNAISSLSRIDVYNGSALACSVDNPVPGERYSVIDNNAKQGSNIYSIGAVAGDGTAGPKATVSGWVGLDVPETPENVTLEEKDGNLTLTWKLPATGMHNGYVNPAEVEYSIFDPTYMIELASVKGTEKVTVSIGQLTSQAVLQFAVAVSNTAGNNPEAALTPTIVAGPAYTLPFYETFPNGKVKYSWSIVGETTDDDEIGWSPVTDKGPDGQPGVSTYWGYWEEDEQALRSRRISLKDADDPVLRFRHLERTGEDSEGGTFLVQISEDYNGPYTTIFEKEITEDSKEWFDAEVNLGDYTGKDIFIQFVAVPLYGDLLVGIDDISIRSALDYDASFESITLDKADVEVGVTSAMVSARIQNHGTLDLADGSYNVNFYAGERIFATLPGKAMTAGFGQSEYQAEYTPDIDDADPTTIWAQIISDIDENSANNRSNDLNINIDKPVCPAVDDLSGSIDGDAVILSWSQPDQNGLPIREVVDDFEAYRNFSINKAGEWTIIDEDQSPGCNVSYYFPGSADPMGWVVLEPQTIPRVGGGTHADRFPPYSGDKYMVAYNPKSGDNKDWLITPELSGNAQEISFMARAESARSGREMFEVYYSVTGTKLADMIRLDNIDWRTTLSGWEEYKFQVPEGAKYFAVRCVSHNRLAMHIDDFKYESAPTPLKVKLLGYNVYRNGERINDQIIAATTYRDMPEADDNSVVYTVRAVYDRGEASHSNAVNKSDMSGIGTIYMDIDPNTQPVYDIQGRRVQHLTEGEIYVTENQKFIYRKH